MFFLAIAGTTQGLKVANIVAATCREGNDMIDRQFGSLSTALTLMIVSLKYIFAHFFGEADALRFFWHIVDIINKTGDARWYKKNIPIAERRFSQHLETLEDIN